MTPTLRSLAFVATFPVLVGAGYSAAAILHKTGTVSAPRVAHVSECPRQAREARNEALLAFMIRNGRCPCDADTASIDAGD